MTGMKHRAFTLVELLTVIGVISLLTAILFAVFGDVRRKAQMIACRANIHELLLSLQAYDSDHHSLPYGYDFKNGAKAPGGLGYMGSGTYVVPGWWWYHYAGIVQDKSAERVKLLRCPSSRLEDRAMNRDVICGKYGVNRALCKVSPGLVNPQYKTDFVGRPLSLGSLEQPGSTLLVVDSGFTLICWWNATACPPMPLQPNDVESTAYVPGLEINKKKVLWPGERFDAIGGRHANKTVNVGFADGHAEREPAGDLLVEKAEDGRYTNTRLWLGGTGGQAAR